MNNYAYDHRTVLPLNDRTFRLHLRELQKEICPSCDPVANTSQFFNTLRENDTYDYWVSTSLGFPETSFVTYGIASYKAKNNKFVRFIGEPVCYNAGRWVKDFVDLKDKQYHLKLVFPELNPLYLDHKRDKESEYYKKLPFVEALKEDCLDLTTWNVFHDFLEENEICNYAKDQCQLAINIINHIA